MCKKRTNMWNKWDGSKVIIRMIVEQGTNKRNDDQLISKHGEEPHHQQMRWWRGQWPGVPKRKAFIFHTQKDVAKWIQIEESQEAHIQTLTNKHTQWSNSQMYIYAQRRRILCKYT